MTWLFSASRFGLPVLGVVRSLSRPVSFGFLLLHALVGKGRSGQEARSSIGSERGLVELLSRGRFLYHQIRLDVVLHSLALCQLSLWEVSVSQIKFSNQ